MQLLAPAQAHLQLHASVLQIHLERNERVALTAHQPGQLANLRLVQKQFLGPEGIGVEDVAVVVGTDVHSLGEDLAAPQDAEAFLQVDLALTHALDFRAHQTQAAFVGFFHEIIVVCLFVLRDGLHAFLVRHDETSKPSDCHAEL